MDEAAIVKILSELVDEKLKPINDRLEHLTALVEDVKLIVRSERLHTQGLTMRVELLRQEQDSVKEGVNALLTWADSATDHFEQITTPLQQV